MPGIDDFYAFTSTSSGSGRSAGGCSGIFMYGLIILGILWIVGKLFG